MADHDFNPDELNFDLSDEDEWTYVDYSQPMLVGKYPCHITEVDITKSKNGNPMWVIDVEIDWDDYKGRNQRGWITVMPKTLGSVKSFLQAVFAREVTTFNMQKAAEDMIGRPCIIAVSYFADAKKKVVRNSIDFWFAVGSVEVGPAKVQPPVPTFDSPSTPGGSTEEPF